MRAFFVRSLIVCLFSFPPLVAVGEEVILPSHPDPSPDGKTVVFAWRGDLWIAASTGGRTRRLTSHPGREQMPKFSPDGKRIAFIGDRGLGNQAYVVPAAGGEPTALTAHTEGYTLEGWYPDGEHLLVGGRRDHYWRRPDRLFKIRADRPSGEQLVFDDYGTEGAVSPDGKRVLFVREGVSWPRKGYVGSQDAQIWLYDAGSQKYAQLLAAPGGCRWPMWKPDGTGFYYVASPAGAANLYDYDLASKKSKQLTQFDDDGVVYPALSRDGSTIVFRRLFDLYRLQPATGRPPTRIRLTADADTTFQPTRREQFVKATEAAFTRDGLEIAFIAGGDVWVMDAELKEPMQVTATIEEERDVVFAPDGETLYFVSDRDGSTDLYRARRGDAKQPWWRNESFPVERLTNDPAAETDVQFRPDGKRLAFVRGRGDLWTADLDGKNPERVFESWNQPEYDWSPDGRWFVYAVYDADFNRDVWIAPADGSGKPYNVSRHPDNDVDPVWSPDGKIIAFTGRRRGEETDIHYVWLRRADDETGARDRTLESALEKFKKARTKPTAAPSATAAKPAAAADQTATTDKSAAATTAAKPAAPNVVIDFDGLHERIRTIALPNAVETDLVWSPGSKRLAFVTTVKGQKGLYSVSFPAPSSAPTLIVAEEGTSPCWLSEGNQIVWLSGGRPASVSASSNRQTTYGFTVRTVVDVGAKYRAAFDQCWRIMRDHWYDDRLGNRNWDEVGRKYRDAAGKATDDLTFSTIVAMMLGELNGSHLGFTPNFSSSGATNDAWRPTTGHLGVRFDPDHMGPGLKIREVLPRGPADAERSRLHAGETIVSIDGVKVDPAADTASLLNGPLPRDVRLRVRAADGKERDVVVRPIPYATATQLLYEQWVRDTRKRVEVASQGKLGYVHIAGMDQVSLFRFEEELFSAASGKSGLVIDVRENGGGFTTDHLLTMLTQPTHAITVPRGGTPGYPQDRKVYAVWNKPIVVLCNQNSFSNAEIFSHAVKTLKRGKLVGVPTAGGVVSTGAVQIMDVGTLRLPTRGWFLPDTGQDMELSGAVPDVVLWPRPGDMPRGKDEQLNKAVEVLLKDVKQWEQRPLPKLIKATER